MRARVVVLMKGPAQILLPEVLTLTPIGVLTDALLLFLHWLPPTPHSSVDPTTVGLAAESTQAAVVVEVGHQAVLCTLTAFGPHSICPAPPSPVVVTHLGQVTLEVFSVYQLHLEAFIPLVVDKWCEVPHGKASWNVERLDVALHRHVLVAPLGQLDEVAPVREGLVEDELVHAVVR